MDNKWWEHSHNWAFSSVEQKLWGVFFRIFITELFIPIINKPSSLLTSKELLVVVSSEPDCSGSIRWFKFRTAGKVKLKLNEFWNCNMAHWFVTRQKHDQLINKTPLPLHSIKWCNYKYNSDVIASNIKDFRDNLQNEKWKKHEIFTPKHLKIHLASIL